MMCVCVQNAKLCISVLYDNHVSQGDRARWGYIVYVRIHIAKAAIYALATLTYYINIC